MPLELQLNGQRRSFDDLNLGDTLDKLVATLNLKSDRIAIECNGEIAPRTTWPEITLQAGDRVEVVHFVGGGLSGSENPHQPASKQNICYRT